MASTGFALDATAVSIIEGHVRLLLAWNEAINLTSISDPAAVARLHVADSLAALPLLAELPHDAVLDLGSGGGFPGLPLAATRPEATVTLVESIGKKAAFLSMAVEALDLAGRVAVAVARAETLPRGRWDVVVARAVGSLAELAELGLPLLVTGGRILAWKRGDLAAELAAATRAAADLGGAPPIFRSHPTALASAAGIEGHGIVVIRKVRPTPPGFPRDPAARRRRPW